MEKNEATSYDNFWMSLSWDCGWITRYSNVDILRTAEVHQEATHASTSQAVWLTLGTETSAQI
eukprot:4598157-Amphidinium_carterae.1